MTGPSAPEQLAHRSLGSRLLLTERDAILPILRATAASDFEKPTVLPGWSVRDVLAHCAAALGTAANGSGHGFSPEENQRDVDERKLWHIQRALDEPDRTLRIGSQPASATLTIDAATFVRLLGGRMPDPARFQLIGTDPSRFVVFH